MESFNPLGLTSLLTLVVSALFIQFLLTRASPTPVVRRFIVLLLIENITLLTSQAGIPLLLDMHPGDPFETILDPIHHLGDVLMLTLYPVFVAYALPVRLLKPLTRRSGRVVMAFLGLIGYGLFLLAKFGVVAASMPPEVALYALLVIMFIVILTFSAAGIRLARTRLEKNKAIAFFCAFGIRDLAWASVYLAAATGYIEDNEMLFNQIYVCGTLVYIPIMAYGILQAQLLDIEIRLRSTIKNTVLAGAFLGLFFVVSEVANNLLSDRFGTVIGLVVSALLTVLLSPLHHWAERIAAGLVDVTPDDERSGRSRREQIYGAAVEEAMAFGEISPGQLALLDRLRDSLELPEPQAWQLEQALGFHRNPAHA